jgi:hypothetical protein
MTSISLPVSRTPSSVWSRGSIVGWVPRRELFEKPSPFLDLWHLQRHVAGDAMVWDGADWQASDLSPPSAMRPPKPRSERRGHDGFRASGQALGLADASPLGHAGDYPEQPVGDDAGAANSACRPAGFIAAKIDFCQTKPFYPPCQPGCVAATYLGSNMMGQRVPLGMGITGLAAVTREVQVGAPTYRDIQGGTLCAPGAPSGMSRSEVILYRLRRA